MEQNLQVIPKRIWSIARAVFFMLRKGLSKKILVDLNMMLKRGKIAGKALGKLMHSHHHHSHSHSHSRRVSSHVGPHEYEFSCSNTPAYTFPSIGHLTKRKLINSNFFGCAHAPPTLEDDAPASAVNAMKAVLEILNNNEMVAVEASPALPGFGRSPFVRQLRITDSPFPLRDVDEDNGFVDKAAEEFIEKFYRELRKQKI
ncbi:hypothetical protein ACOSP7_020387 [Xanthoceras sorbifolium]|uniref:Avr9/Cf-9 rapidly elicited protein 146 n=1 Tax=Xanthoceras sorbifolium TaxID=99658 RepID=A0ABQ8HLR7_9ROSI|nr:hypothetical protein JRO89_XS09G0183500 [Xanthoceras sorbifolium]